jgi:sugar lactone lactonase YvrE
MLALANTGLATADEGQKVEAHSEGEVGALVNSHAPPVVLPEAPQTSHPSAPMVNGAPPAGAEGKDGLNPGEKVPAWAGHRLVHFVKPVVRSSQLGGGAASPLVSGGPGETLKYWGGPVQHEPQLNLLFWGSRFWETETSPVGLGAELEFFFYGLNNESLVNPAWQGILSQYWSNTAGPNKHARVTAESRVTAVGAPKSVTDESIRAEINLWIANGASFNENTQFIVMLAPGTTYSQLLGCGYHGVGEYNGREYVYGVVPYAGDANAFYKGSASCNRVTWKTHEGETQQLMWSTTGVASHEFAESVTDPMLYPGAPFTSRRAWSSNPEGDTEIADLCIDREEEGLEHAIEELPAANGRVGWTYVNKLWDDAGGNTCKLEDPPYSEPPPPSVTTEGATSMTASAATLTGTLNPNGPDAHYYFEIGFTTSYGTDEPFLPGNDAGFGTNSTPVAVRAEGLVSNEPYHYRLVASTWAGTSYGADHTFETLPLLPMGRTGPATEIGPTVARLQGEVSPNESKRREDRTNFYFEYGPTTAYGSHTTEEFAQVSGLSYANVSQNIASLSPKNTYHYRVVAISPGGTTYGADRTFSTTASPYAATEAPTNVTVGEATLRGKVNPGGYSTTYQFEYWPSGKSSEVKYVPAAAEAAGSGTSTLLVSQKVAGLVGFAPYAYRLRATSSLGTTYGEIFTVTAWPSFLQQTTPNPSGATEARLVNVSCTSAILCTAVGWAEVHPSEGVYVATVEQWDGTEWTLQSVPAPSEAKSTYLEGVSCVSTTRCIAVGNYSRSGGFSGMAVRWNGTSWSQETMPMPSGANFAELRSVACVSTTECVAVGGYTNSANVTQTLAERWNGTSWSVQSTPNGNSESNNELRAISCTSATACTATGSYTSSLFGPQRPIAERWNGTAWTMQTVPNPSGSEGSELAGVACMSATSCIATGSGYNNEAKGPYFPVVDIWNGTAWTQMTLPSPTGSEEDAFLETVSCASITSCVAVGHYSINGRRSYLPLAERWNGTEWTVDSAEGENSIIGELHGISCGATLTCTAVGDYLNAHMVTLAEAILPPNVSTEAASSISETGATLNGHVNPEARETTYHFEYGTTVSYGTQVPVPDASAGKGSAAQSASQTVTGLQPATTYHYRLAATNIDGTTNSEDRIFTTPGRPGVETRSATNLSSEGATLNGGVEPKGLATTYHFEYGTTTSYGTKAPVPDGNAGSGAGTETAQQAITGLLGNTTYHFRLVATNSAGTTNSEDRTFTTPAPSVPVYSSSFGAKGTGSGQFEHPGDVVVDPKGNLWVADHGNSRIEEFNEKGEYQKTFGSSGTGNGQLSGPDGLAVDSKGNVWVVDTGNSRVEEFNEKGEYVKTFGSSGTGNGQFKTPEGITVDSHNNIWVSDTYNGRLEEFNEKGEYLKTVGSKGSGTGQIGESEGIAVGPGNSVWVADWLNNRVEEFNEKGEYVTEFGTEGTGNGQLKHPYGITVDTKGEVWVADTNNYRVEGFNEKGEYLTQFGTKGSEAGQFSFSYPIGLTANAKREIWITDSSDNRIENWK